MQKTRSWKKTGSLVLMGALLGGTGCGSPASPAEEATRTGTQGLVAGVDFVVTEVRAPASTRPGEVFPAYVKVCNVGDTGDSVDVGLFFSSDELIKPEDMQLGVRAVDYLAPGQCTAPLEVSAAAPQSVGGGYIGAIVDPSSSHPEAEEGNNARLGGRMAVGLGPNFVVRSVSGHPSSLSAGEHLASVTVCNEGTEPGSGEVELLLSEDEVIARPGKPSADTPVGQAPFLQLMPRQCTTLEVHTRTQVVEGLWYLGAIVDPNNGTQELSEDDNTRVGSRVSVGSGPDMVVKSVKGPASRMAGDRLFVDVEVCNQGLDAAGASLELFLSSDEVISGPEAPQPDVRIGGEPVDMLLAGQCVTRRVHVSGHLVPAGSWYLGAIVGTYVPERRMDNNALAGNRLVGGDAPDFVVKSVKGSPSVWAGGPLSASVTLCNQGTLGASTGAVLVLSRDEDIAWSPVPGQASDTLVAPVPSTMLMPGQCSTQQVTTSSNLSPGAWYLGAVADADGAVSELVESNNARVGNAVGLGNQADLVVKSVKGPASARPGEFFFATVEVCNQGTEFGSAPLVVVLSADEDIQYSSKYVASSDHLLMEVPVAPLAPGHCATQQVPVNGVPGSMMGAWYLGARVDPYELLLELIEDNNGLAGNLMGVGDVADLAVKSLQVTASAYPGGPFTARVKVCNEGATSGPAPLGFFLSPHPAASRPLPWAGDVLLQSDFLGYLSPRQCETREVVLPANAPGEGPWYLKAVVDPNASSFELIPGNNMRVAGPLALGQRPDFVVKSVKAPASVRQWEGFTTSIMVCNEGTQAGGTSLDVVFSADETIAPPGAASGDMLGGVVHVNYLMPGQCAPYVVQGPAAVYGEGAYYLGVIADLQGMTPELNEDNNAFLGPRIGVGLGPDFVVKSVKGPASVRSYESFTASVEVCNQGNIGGGVEGQLVLSADEVLSPFDVPFDHPVWGFSVPYLQAGQCTTQQVPTGFVALPEGAWHLGAWLDPNGLVQELIEDNNGHAGGLMGIGDQADFIVKSMSGPASVRPGQSFTASVTVCNQGTLSGDTQVLLLLSSDTSFEVPQGAPGGDTVIGQVSTGMLNAGQCVTRQVSVYGVSLPEGAYYLGAIANPGQNPELIDRNNTHVGPVVGLGDAPDFVVKSVTGPASIRPGQSFTASVRVCNQGTQGGYPDVEFVFSHDARIALGEDMVLGHVGLDFVDAGQCVTRDMTFWGTPMMSQGAYFLGAIADAGGWVRELIETNNTLAGSLVGVGDAPDFVVKSVTAPANVRPGEFFTTSVTLCNQGTRGDSAMAMLMLSADEELSPPGQGSPDFMMGDVSVGYLDAGQCITQEAHVNASVPGGTWYVGVLVNPEGWVQELNHANNQRVAGPMGVGHGPDFIVKSVTGPANLRPGDTFTASATVCNVGTTPGSALVSILLSQDTDIVASQSPSAPDILLATESLGWMEPGRCVRMPVRVPSAYVPEPGVWYLGAVADPADHEFELNEGNNARAGEALGAGNGADFVVKSVSVPASVRPSQPFTATATVCNQGNLSGVTELGFVLKTEAELAEPGLPQGPGRILGGAFVGSLEPGHCLTLPVSLNAASPLVEAVWFVEAVADLQNSTQELLEDNNSRTSEAMGLGHGPDLVVTGVSVPRRVQLGSVFITEVSVCNQGTDPAYDARVQLLFSADERIDLQGPQPSDYPFSSVWTGSLVPGQCVSIPVRETTPPPSLGNWYVGGFVDLDNSYRELIESNNGLVGNVVEFYP